VKPLPRRKSDSVVTHRIELGSFERERAEEYLSAQLVSKTAVGILSAASGLVGGAGVLLVGWAAMEYIGIPLADEAKTWYDKITNSMSTFVADAVASRPGSLSEQTKEWGDELIKLQANAAFYHSEMPLYCDSSKDAFNKHRCNQLQTNLMKNIDRQEVLRVLIDDVATGKTMWWDIPLH